MSASNSSITSERRGYSRGLILGLTMAETFMLLVFCLLLVVAAAIASQRKEMTAATAERDRVVEPGRAREPGPGSLDVHQAPVSTAA